jgi:hypothetical protein
LGQDARFPVKVTPLKHQKDKKKSRSDKAAMIPLNMANNTNYRLLGQS